MKVYVFTTPTTPPPSRRTASDRSSIRRRSLRRFVWSGASHARDPEASSKDLGLPKPVVLLAGVVELLAGLGVAGGLLTRLSAVGLMIVMLGAMHRKAFVWHTGFWGKNAMGWHYDLIFF